MNKKILSISIAAYNVADYLSKTVGSLIIDQERFDKIEVIIVNDGSKDETSSIAHDLESRYPNSVVVIDKSNGGYGSTINAALDIATGRYFKLLDGDDWFDQEGLGGLIDYLEDCDSDMVISPYYEVRKSYCLADNHPEIPAKCCAIEAVHFEKMGIAMHEIAIQTELLKNLGKKITEKCFYTDAEYVFYCLCAAKTISRFEKPVYCYRLEIEGQSVSISGIRKHYRDLPKVSESMYECYADQYDHFKDQANKKELLDFCIRTISHHTYRAFLLLEDVKSERKTLVNFDKHLKKDYPFAYTESNKSKLVHLARIFHFRPYAVISKMALRQFKQENS